MQKKKLYGICDIIIQFEGEHRSEVAFVDIPQLAAYVSVHT